MTSLSGAPRSYSNKRSDSAHAATGAGTQPSAQEMSPNAPPRSSGVNYFTQLLLDQAKAMYRYWPETGDRLFDEQ